MFMFNQVKGFSPLTDTQKNILERTYNRHTKAWGEENRLEYTIDQIKEVKWDAKACCIKVFFKNGNWWHYLPDGSWF